MPEGSRNWSIHFLLSSAFRGKTCFFIPYLIQPQGAVIAVVVRKKSRRGKGEGAGRPRRYTESPGVFSPNTGKGRGTLDTFRERMFGWPQGGRWQWPWTDYSQAYTYHFLRAKVYQWFHGILLRSRCPFSEGRGKKEWKEGRSGKEVRGRDGQGK